jgi:hypothetical protein
MNSKQFPTKEKMKIASYSLLYNGVAIAGAVNCPYVICKEKRAQLTISGFYFYTNFTIKANY